MRRKVELCVNSPDEAKWYNETGKLSYKGGITEYDMDLFFDTDSHNKYIPNKLAQDFGISIGKNTGSYSLVFDASTIDVLYKFLSKYYDVSIVKSEGTQYIEDMINNIKNKYKNDPVALEKNLQRYYHDNNLNSNFLDSSV